MASRCLPIGAEAGVLRDEEARLLLEALRGTVLYTMGSLSSMMIVMLVYCWLKALKSATEHRAPRVRE
jgi:hypothetical protein